LFISSGQNRTMSSMASVIATVDEARCAPRTHLFVAAMLHWDAGLAPVNIRNMSPTGALIESPIVPDVRTSVVLKRGSLSIAGRIAWKAGRKCGVAFSSTTHVADWMPRGSASGQARVDRIVSDFKAGRPLDGSKGMVERRLGEDSLAVELRALRSELGELGDSLIGDAVLIATHPEIQTLDIALQRIDRLIGQLGDKT
jgi:hypothetical protein